MIPAPIARAPVLLPIRTVAGLNAREHWQARSRRVKAEREATAWGLKGQPAPATPCSVLLTRLGPTRVELDDDNLAGSLKGVRDAVATWLKVDDRDRARVRYAYAQERSPEWGVRIAFGPHCEGCDLAERGAPSMYVAACGPCMTRMLASIKDAPGILPASFGGIT